MKHGTVSTNLVQNKHINSVRTRFTVTCLYFQPNDKARTLSILISVDITIEISLKTNVEIVCARWISRIMLNLTSIICCKSRTAPSGCETRPTQRSIIAKKRNRSFVGARIEDTFPRATRISVFATIAVKDRSKFTAMNGAGIAGRKRRY